MSSPSFPPPVIRALAAVGGPDDADPHDAGPASARPAVAIVIDRPWPGRVWAADGHWIWSAPPGSGRARAEAAGLAALAGHLPCPTVVLVHADWLVTTAPAGHPATEPERQPRPDDVPGLIGAALRRLHDLDPTTPLVGGRPHPEAASEGIQGRIEAGLAAGAIEADLLPEPYRRYGPAQLLDLVGQGAERSAAAAERAGDTEVVAHGDPVVDNWFLDAGQLVAVTGLHRLSRADRHLDVAIAYRSIHDHFGPEAVFGFVEGYGRDPDLIRLDHHLLLAVLLDQLDPVPPPAPGGAPQG